MVGRCPTGGIVRSVSGIRQWRRERRGRRQQEAAVRRQLLDDYLDLLANGDRDTLNTSRDFYLNHAGSWWARIVPTAYMLVLIALVIVLVCFFSVIKALAS
jgi:hypothetical protein